MSTSIGIVIVKPHFYSSGDDVIWWYLNWKSCFDALGSQITGEEELDIFLLELARHFPKADIDFKFDRRHKLVLDLKVITDKKSLNYPYWKIPANSPLARFFPTIVAIVYSDRIDRRIEFDSTQELQYKSLPITKLINK